jgi:hypothetical protein
VSGLTSTFVGSLHRIVCRFAFDNHEINGTDFDENGYNFHGTRSFLHRHVHVFPPP